MTEVLWKISGGYVYDPLNGVDGQVQDIWIQGGKIVPPPSDPHVQPASTLNAAGLVVMPGGIDMHCHIAGPKVNAARKMRPEEKRGRQNAVMRTAHTHSGTLGSVPSTFATGYKYIGLGYTTAFDAAVPPLMARHAHEEFDDTPCIDKGFYVLVGNNHFVMRAIQERQPEQLKGFVAWLLGAAKAYAVKLVNPGGVEVWKCHASGNVHTAGRNRRSLRCHAAADHPRDGGGGGRTETAPFGPHPLQQPGPARQLADDAGNDEGPGRASRAHHPHPVPQLRRRRRRRDARSTRKSRRLADYVNEHPNVSVDVGQVLFGETTSMTGDGPLGYYLHNVYGTKWFSADTEMEAGCGIAPIKYRNKSLVHAWQWAIGLEWYLLVQDPWRVVMSTDHPNGGSFLAYPQIIRLLMDSTYRKDVLKEVHAARRPRLRAGRPGPRVLAERNRDHHASRTGQAAGAEAQRPPGPRCGRRRHDLHAAREQGIDVPAAAVRDQVRPAVDRRRRPARDLGRQDAVRRTQLRRGLGNRHRRLVRAVLHGPFPQLSGRRRLSARLGTGGLRVGSHVSHAMLPETFRCYLVTKDADGKVHAEVTQRPLSELPAGDTLIRVAYSSLNYKDALAATGHPGVNKQFPHIPGVDAAGRVVACSSGKFSPNEPVLVTGFDMGANRWGGWAEYVRVPGEWVVPLPPALTLRDSMILGTAGFTAGLCVDALQKHDVAPDSGDVVVTGASGGVGTFAVALLAKLGYHVTAITGKASSHEYLRRLGAEQILGRDQVDDRSGKPLLSGRWAGAVDTVGSNILGTILRATRHGGCVAACGLAAGQRSAGDGSPLHPARRHAGRDRRGLGADSAAP